MRVFRRGILINEVLGKVWSTHLLSKGKREPVTLTETVQSASIRRDDVGTIGKESNINMFFAHPASDQRFVVKIEPLDSQSIVLGRWLRPFRSLMMRHHEGCRTRSSPSKVGTVEP